MTLEEAASSVYRWLTTLPIQFSSMIMANDLGGQHFSVAVEQLLPVHKMLKFRVEPLDVADCYEVKELEAA